MTPYLKKKIIKNAICWPFIIAGIVGVQIGNHYAKLYASNITGLLCPSTAADIDLANEAASKGNELTVEIEEEGIVLTQNRNNTLPLAKSIKKVNVFGRGAIEWHYGGAGSGAVYTGSTRESDNLVTALKSYGIEVNDDLIKASQNIQSKVSDKHTLQNETEITSKIFEPKVSEYSSAYEGAKNFSDTAIVAIGRYGGEGNDLMLEQITRYGRNPDRTTLDFSPEEEQLLRKVAQDFSNVIVVINSTNQMSLRYVEEIEGVDACLVVGGTGCVGARAIPKVLYGDVNPSGHLVDTYPYDLKTIPSYWVTGYENLGIYQGSRSDNLRSFTTDSSKPGRGGDRGTTGNTRGGIEHGAGSAAYSDYIEGIYNGYRWFETADAEGYWDKAPYEGYNKVVQYPFGFGMSYSTFEWEIDKTNLSLADGSSINENTQLTIPVKVTNTGTVDGKDVIEVYLTAPYTKGGIEKSAVQLVGYAKTPLLKPEQQCVVNFKVDTWDFKSFDDYDKNNNGFYGYEMEKGNYLLTLRTDAHNIKDNAHASNYTLTYVVNNDIKIDKERDTGTKIQRVLSGPNAADGISCDGIAYDGENVNAAASENINFFSRENFPALNTSKPANRTWNTRLDITKDKSGAKIYNGYCKDFANAWDSATVDVFGNPVDQTPVTFGQGSNVMLIDKMQLTEDGVKAGADYNDPIWDKVMDSLTYDQCKVMVNETHSFNRPEMPFIGSNQLLSDNDGPCQLNPFHDFSNETTTVGYPSAPVVGQTWNENMAFKMGKSMGNDMLTNASDGLYGFGGNTHHSPFCGRNFEYYSEDPFLGGKQVAQACRGVQVSGKSTYLKHYAANDSEQWRCGLYTWMTEQSYREIYGKVFEYAVKSDSTTGIMSGLNRIGATWAGGNEGALQGILRNEWGFHGVVITDYAEDPIFMDFCQATRAGGTLGLSDKYNQSGTCGALPKQNEASPRLQRRIKETMKETIWMYVHALYLNKKYNDDIANGLIDDEAIISYPSKQSWVWWIPAKNILIVTIYVGLGVGAYFLVRPVELESMEKPSKGKKAKKEAK